VKLLLITALYAPYRVGGGELSAQSLAEGMRESGHTPIVLTCDRRPGIRVGAVNGVKVYYIGLKNVYWPYGEKRPGPLIRAIWHAVDRYNPWMERAVDRVLEFERPSVVSTQIIAGFSCSVWHAVKRRGLPLFHTLRDYSLMCPKATMFKSRKNCVGQCRTCRAYTAPSRALSARVDGVIGISRYILERHIAAGYFPAARERHVIYNGVPAPSRAACSRRGGDEPLRLGYVGRLDPTKGIGLLVDAVRHWPPSQCRLVVAGRGTADYEGALRRRAPANTEFLGFVDPDEVYRRIDVLVVPSLWDEPFGRIVAEAYMHGIPVIAADRGGLPELVEHGKTGFIYPSHSASALREAIETFVRTPGLVDGLRGSIAAKARYFGLERMTAEYRSLLCGRAA